MRLNLSLGLLTGLQLLVNLLTQLAVLRAVGTGGETDAFVAAQAVPMVVFAILAVSLQSVWQPRLAVAAHDTTSWRREQGMAQAQTLIVFGLATAALFGLRGAWIPLIYPGFAASQLQLVSELTAPLLTATLLNGHTALLTSALRARARFIVGEAVVLASHLMAFAMVLWWVPEYGVQAAAWVSLGRAALVCAALAWQADWPPIKLRAGARASDVWRQLMPLLMGSSLYKTSPLVDRFWSSQAAAGSVTIFNLAMTANGAVATILERAISMPVAPRMARDAAAGHFAAVRATYRRCVLRISALVLVFAVALGASRPLWASLVAPTLNITPPLAEQMWLICLLLLAYLHVAASGTIAVNTFYAMGDTRTPVKVGVVGFLIGVVLKSAGFLVFGLTGLAAATSLYYAGNMVAMCVLLERRLREELS